MSSCFLLHVSASVFRVVCLQVCRQFLLPSRYLPVFMSAVNCLCSRYLSVFRSAVNCLFVLGTCLSSGQPLTASFFSVHVCLQPCHQLLLPSRYLSVFSPAVNFLFLLFSVRVCLQPCRQLPLPSRYMSVFRSAVNCLCSRYLTVFRPR